MADSSSESKMVTAKAVFSAAASVSASIMLALANDLLPHKFQEYFFSGVQNFFSQFLSQRLKVSKPEKENEFNVSMEPNEEVIDVLHGVKVINSYLPQVVEVAKSLRQEKKTLKLFTPSFEHMYGNLLDAWTPVNLDHPAMFETLAMDSEIKKTILEDLERFVKRRDYNRTIGKAWKRGYLLHGPPGTGKLSLVAAMANYLNFDIHDLGLTELKCNSDRRRLLVATASRSILVVEDIDCTIEFHDWAAEVRAANFPPGYAPERQRMKMHLMEFSPLHYDNHLDNPHHGPASPIPLSFQSLVHFILKGVVRRSIALAENGGISLPNNGILPKASS
ncbi:hypothetical protein CDL15_Pgr005243 [Punica granatum]|uniref:ATPase AAA-type core domain-containing protein n=1 Tax=Punica granatum TaxID=22663 RepID=A0A218WPW9_PUNGR|nr:hypothetical protein CDL15_Pgr005243 [Punica granatum]